MEADGPLIALIRNGLLKRYQRKARQSPISIGQAKGLVAGVVGCLGQSVETSPVDSLCSSSKEDSASLLENEIYEVRSRVKEKRVDSTCGSRPFGKKLALSRAFSCEQWLAETDTSLRRKATDIDISWSQAGFLVRRKKEVHQACEKLKGSWSTTSRMKKNYCPLRGPKRARGKKRHGLQEAKCLVLSPKVGEELVRVGDQLTQQNPKITFKKVRNGCRGARNLYQTNQ